MSLSELELYTASVKCKYCSHFYAARNKCCLYSDYDSELSRTEPSRYYKDTTANSVCDRFSLPAMAAMAHSELGKPPATRKDGSLIVDLKDLKLIRQQNADELRKKYAEQTLKNQKYSNAGYIGCGIAVILLILAFLPLLF